MPIDATESYDDQNVFAKILRGEIPSRRIFEDEFALAFHDINPQAPHHVLVIPKGAYVSWDDFSARASEAEIAGFVRAVGQVAREAGFVAPGYRLLANTGLDAHQEVPHLHVHIFAGKPLGPMLARQPKPPDPGASCTSCTPSISHPIWTAWSATRSRWCWAR